MSENDLADLKLGPELNRIVAVQECDATMMKRKQMPVTKN
jgi:hypothetical protein